MDGIPHFFQYFSVKYFMSIYLEKPGELLWWECTLGRYVNTGHVLQFEVHYFEYSYCTRMRTHMHTHTHNHTHTHTHIHTLIHTHSLSLFLSLSAHASSPFPFIHPPNHLFIHISTIHPFTTHGFPFRLANLLAYGTASTISN